MNSIMPSLLAVLFLASACSDYDVKSPRHQNPNNEQKPKAGSPSDEELEISKSVMEPTDVPGAVNSYEEALAEIDKAQAQDPNLKNFWIGGSYDVLSGNRTPTCLDTRTLRTKLNSPMETTDSYSVSHDYRDFYSKLEAEFGADIGGIWQIFSAGLSFKTKIMKETKMTTDDVVIIAGTNYHRDVISIENPAVSYAKFFQSLSEKNPALFRKYCGDKYTKDVTNGASMHLVFTAKKMDSSSWEKTKIEAAIRVGLAGILGFGASTDISKEQREILNSYSFSTKCYSLGTSPEVCASFGTGTAFDISSDTANIQRKIDEARKKFRSEIKEGKYLTVVRETLLDYEVPLSACTLSGNQPCPSRWEYFADYRTRLTKLKQFSLDKTEAEDICTRISYWPRRCAIVKESFDTVTNNCRSLVEECKDPDSKELKVILSAKNPGRVELWDNAGFGGSFYGLDFRNFLNGNPLEALKFYTLEEIGMKKANDKATSIRSFLQPAWTIRFFRDTNRDSSGQQYDVAGTRAIDNIGFTWSGSNDKISAFELIPAEDL